MSERAKLKKLSSVSQEELIKENIWDFDTWPVLPSGLLQQPSSAGFDTKNITRQIIDASRRVEVYIDNFIRSRETIMIFLFSSLIGVMGNLVITLIFSEKLIIYNLELSCALSFLIIISIWVAIMYVPTYSMPHIIQGEYEEFPKDKAYGSLIDSGTIKEPYMKMYLDPDYFPSLITKYSIFVRASRLKDAIVNALKKTKFVKIKKISQRSDYYPSFSISFTTNLRAFLPRNKELIRSEFMSLNGAVNRGIIGSGVMAFELDEGEWRKYGAQFLNEISHIDLDDALDQLTDEIKSACKGPREKKVKKNRRSFSNVSIIDKISLIQNSVLTWLVVGLSSWLGIIELSSSKLLHRWLIFELLLLVAIFSSWMVVAKMNDILDLKEKSEGLMNWSKSAARMDGLLRFLGRERVVPIFRFQYRIISVFMVILFFVSQIFWFARASKVVTDFLEAVMYASATYA